MKIKRILAVIMTLSLIFLTSCGGSFQQPQYTTRPETGAVTEATTYVTTAETTATVNTSSSLVTNMMYEG